MADLKISQLPAVVSVAAASLVPIVQAGVTSKATVAQLTAGSTTDVLATLAAPGGAGLIGNTPAGSIAATTVQAAINELDTEKTTTAFVLATFAVPPTLGSSVPGAVAATTITASGTITPAQLAGIVGTTTNNNANAGSVGEFITATGAAVALTNATQTNITSIALTAGDWDVDGSISYTGAGGTLINALQSSSSTVSATAPAAPFVFVVNGLTMGANNTITGTAPVRRMSLAAPTTVFLVGFCGFTVGTCAATGYISARRVR